MKTAFIKKVEAECNERIAREVQVELRNGAAREQSSMAVLAKVLAAHDTAQYPTSEPFDSIPVPMAPKRKRR